MCVGMRQIQYATVVAIVAVSVGSYLARHGTQYMHAPENWWYYLFAALIGAVLFLWVRSLLRGPVRADRHENSRDSLAFLFGKKLGGILRRRRG